MKLTVIIVSHNTKKLLEDCLNSIYHNLPKEYEIIVVDNASTDNSSNLVKTQFSQVKLIKNSTNTGYAHANNLGIKQARGEYLLLLNSDTLASNQSFSVLISWLDNHPKVGIASPKILNLDGTTQPNGGAIPTQSNIFTWMFFLNRLPLLPQIIPNYHAPASYFNKTHPIGWVSGAALCLRRQCLEQIGLLDEKIFMYAEDIDFCLRAYRSGWQIWTVSTCSVTHFGQGSGSKSKAILGEFQGLKYLFTKHYPKSHLYTLKKVLELGTLLRILIFGTIFANKQLKQTYEKALTVARQ